MLAASQQRNSSLATCALRPPSIYGEWDTRLLPIYVKLCLAGFCKTTIGDGKQLSEAVYAGNCAWALVLAGEMMSRNGALDGEALFVSDQVCGECSLAVL